SRRLALRSHRMIRLAGVPHTATFAPAGVGKTKSLVVPFLLECRDSMVIVDFKGELALLTAKQRQAMGHEIILLDPYQWEEVKDLPYKRATFNPLDFIRKDDPLVIDDARDIASALARPNPREHDPYWSDSARDFITTVIAGVIQEGDAHD